MSCVIAHTSLRLGSEVSSALGLVMPVWEVLETLELEKQVEEVDH